MSENTKPTWLPQPHFMALGPLDVWARLLCRLRGVPSLRYGLRIVFGLATSTFATVVTLPERVLLWPMLWWRFGRGQARLEHKPGVLVIAGYYRTGTTHLHYLLSCDPAMVTPRWVHVGSPQGFVLSWALLRWAMIPFVSNSRPQDDVAFGPEWPSEDDFAANNWGLASSLPGRFVIPSRHEEFGRFHDLKRLSEDERGRWRRVQAGFCWKMVALRSGKRLLLKTPSHTARLDELAAMFGDGLRVIHISRDPGAVVESNVRMAERFEPYGLEPVPAREEIRRRIVEEYAATERDFVEAEARLGAGRVVRIRFEDVLADPMGQLKGAYERFGYAWSAEAERGFRRYLASVREYKPRHGAASDVEALEPALREIAEEFGHSKPAVGHVAMEHAVPRKRAGLAYAATVLGAVVLAGAWVAFSAMTEKRSEVFLWVLGMLVGLIGVRTAGRGSRRLGLVALACMAGIVLPAAYPATLAAYADRWAEGEQFREAWSSCLRMLGSTTNLLYLGLGLVSAYRVGSREHVKPPGT